MSKISMKPLEAFFEIQRVDDKTNIVEGYCYVNGKLPGEGGYNLTRKAMEDATDDYMKWGAIREMHGSNAAGTATAEGCGITWDEKGAFLRALIVDPVALEKCKTRVYKGFSLRARPEVVRGQDVTKVTWYENSLVDRPKDPDCPITLARAEGIDPADEYEVTEETEGEPAEVVRAEVDPDAEAERVLDLAEAAAAGAPVVTVPADGAEPATEADPEAAPDVERADGGITSATVPARENLEGKPKGDTHYNCGAEYGCCGHTTRGGAQECAEKTGQKSRSQGYQSEIAYHQKQMDRLTAEMEKRGETGTDSDLTRAEGTPGVTETPSATEPAPAATAPRTEGENAPSSFEDFIRSVTDSGSDLTQIEPHLRQLFSRAETAERDLSIVRADLSAAAERVRVLEATPRSSKPVKYPDAIPIARRFAANEGDASGEIVRQDIERVDSEYKDALAKVPAITDQSARQQEIVRLQVMRRHIHAMTGRDPG